MKYLKRYGVIHSLLEQSSNLSEDDFTDKLKEFCENSLAYLLDDGYDISISLRDQVKYPDKPHIIVSLGLPNENYVPLRPYDGYRKFHWDDVKDYYIPFLQLLVRRYELLPYLGADAHIYVCFNTASGFRYLSLDQVINDKTGLDYPIWGINLQILDKI